jgi:hypothetical protein
MHDFASEFASSLNHYESLLRELTEEQFLSRPAPGKWSKKEELGHLIDSAQNNIRRIIAAQYEDVPNIFYHQDYWVAANGYQGMSSDDLITLWLLLNRQFARIVSSLPEEALAKTCDTGRTEPEIVTLDSVIRDYPKHMRHHLHHLLELEAVAYP